MNDYSKRMSEHKYFKEFRIRPQWQPRKADIAGFIHDEVVRQGWDPRTPDGKARIRYMHKAWGFAVDRAARSLRPGLDDLLKIAYYVEPGENRNGYRRGVITVGGRAKGWLNIPEKVKRLWSVIENVEPITGRTHLGEGTMTADDFYVEFEEIHPFRDGNGRTGKIIHNWILGTLLDPILVRDYFGGGTP